MRRRRAAILPTVFLLMLQLPCAVASEALSQEDATTIQTAIPQGLINTETFEYNDADSTWIFSGNTSVELGDSILLADRIVLWHLDEQGYAEGNVRIVTDDGKIAQADRAFFNWASGNGITLDAIFDARFQTATPEDEEGEDWFVSTEELLRTSKGRYEAHNATLTNCSFGSPHHYFKADSLTFVEEDKVVAKHVVYYVNGVPVFYVPYLYKDLQRKWPWIRAQVGSSSRLGTYVLTEVGQSIGEHFDVGINLDYLSNRGFASGLTFEYDWTGIQGRFESFWLPNDKGDDTSVLEMGDTNRWRYKFAHQQHVQDDWEFVVELQKYSDAGVRSEFFEDEDKEDKEVENRVYAKYTHENLDLNATLKLRDDDFLDQAEYYPRVGLDLFGQPILDTFLLTINAQAAYLEREFSELRARPTENPYITPLPRLLWYLNHLSEVNMHRIKENAPLPYPAPLTDREALTQGRDIARFDTQVELTMPVKSPYLTIEPFVKGRGSWYEENLHNAQHTSRTQYGAGARLSTQLSRVYDVEGAKSDLTQLRHTVTAELQGESLSRPTTEREDLLQIDDVDEVGRKDSIVLSLINRLAARGHEQDKHDLLYHELSLARINTDIGSRTSFLSNARLSPNRGFYLFLDMDYTIDSQDALYEDGLEALRTGIVITPDRPWNFYIGNRYLRDSSSQTTLEIASVLSDRYRGRFRAEHDWGDAGNSAYKISFERSLHDFILEMGYEFKERDSESVFFVNFRLITGRASTFGRPYQRTTAERTNLILK